MAEEEPQDWESYQRGPPDVGVAIVADALVGDMGSDQPYADAGRADMRRFTVIEKRDLPFLLYAKMRSRKSRIWRTLYDETLNLKVGIGGRGRRDIIRVVGVAKGGGATVEGEIPKHPSWFKRNVTDREWERKQREEQIMRGE